VPYVTGADILAKAGATDPTSDDTQWAASCADAIEALIARRLTGFTPTAGDTNELERAALLDGLGCYADRKAPHGIIAMGPDGDPVRRGQEISRALEPVLFAITGPGIG
jgi:hypothetical protein